MAITIADMTDYTSASSAAASALDSSAEMVEEYEVAPGGRRRVKRGKVTDQVHAAALLEGLAARRAAGGLFRVAKRKDPRP